MFPGMNGRQAKQMMRKMGIQQQELDASQVIIKLQDKELIINEPSVTKINMQGTQTFQISGNITEQSLEKFEINEEDIETVMEQTSCTKEEAKSALKDTEGDIAEAIINLSE